MVIENVYVILEGTVIHGDSFLFGEKMMRAAAALAVEWGCCRFDWTAEKDNVRALAFYDRLSAQRVDEKVYFRAVGTDLLRLAGTGPGA